MRNSDKMAGYFSGVLKIAFPVFLCLTVGILAVYGSARWLPDTYLVLLLRILRYSAFIFAIVSFCALGYSVRLLIQSRKKRYVPLLFICLFCGFLGLILSLFGNGILVITG